MNPNNASKGQPGEDTSNSSRPTPRDSSQATPQPAAQGQEPSFLNRLANSASTLARDAVATDRDNAASLLSRNLQANGKASGSGQQQQQQEAHAQSASGAASSSSAAASLQNTSQVESFRSGETHGSHDMLAAADERPFEPLMDDARNSVYDADGAFAEYMRTHDWASASAEKGKGKAGAEGEAWVRQFGSGGGGGDDVSRIYGSTTDGADVIGILSDPAFDLSAMDDVQAQEPASAESLFGGAAGGGGTTATAMETPHSATAPFRETSSLVPSNPDVLSEMTGLPITSAEGDVTANDAWLSQWSDVLEHYTDYVWSPEERRLIDQARVEMDKLKEEKSDLQVGDEGQSQTVRRLRQILGHLDPKAVQQRSSSNSSSGGKASFLNVPEAQTNGNEWEAKSALTSRDPSPESWD